MGLLDIFRKKDESITVDVIGPGSDGYLGNLVFLHGLDGEGINTWKGKKGEIWPKWLAENKKFLKVYLPTYNTSSSFWKNKSLPIVDLANMLLHCLKTEMNEDKPTIFICHSLGGLLFKQLLRKCFDSSAKEYKTFLSNVTGVIFFATPHQGSRIADTTWKLRRLHLSTALIHDLKTSNSHLFELDYWFRENYDQFSLKTEVYYETKKTIIFMIVDRGSADPGIKGINPIPVEENHINICKMELKSDTRYKSACSLIENSIKNFYKFDEIRMRDIEIVKRIVEHPHINALVISGVPGIGKTFFSRKIIEYFPKEKIIHVQAGSEENATALASAILASGLRQLMNLVLAKGFNAIEDLSSDELADLISQVISDFDVLLVVEKLQLNSFDVFSLWSRILSNVKRGSIKFIINSYAPLDGLESTEQYAIGRLGIEDSIRLLLRYDENIDLTDAVRICNELKGHPFSLVSWVKSTNRQGGLPRETREMFVKIYDKISRENQQLILSICKEPRLLDVLKYEDLNRLYMAGLLSKYESGEVSQTFYLHDIVRDSLQSKSTDLEEERYITYLNYAQVKGFQWSGPAKVRELFKTKKTGDAETLFLEGGRAWIETLGLREGQGFISSVKLNVKSDTISYLICKYLEGLILLFSGGYNEAKGTFSWMLKEYSTNISEHLRVALQAEIIECERRLGEAGGEIGNFNALLASLNRLKFAQDDGGLNTHFLGVGYFLAGHYFRHFAEYQKAIHFYECAEKEFLKKNTLGDQIEALHCAYVKTQCTRNYHLQTSEVYEGDSLFINGLISSIYFKNNCFKKDYTTAKYHVERAKDFFSKFNSPVYYRRTLALEALMNVAFEKDFKNCEFFNITVTEKKGRYYFLHKILSSFAINDGLVPTYLNDAINELSTSGNYGVILSLISLCKHLGFTYDGKQLMEVKYLHLSEKGEYEIFSKNIDVDALISEVMGRAKLSNLEDAIFLFD